MSSVTDIPVSMPPRVEVKKPSLARSVPKPEDLDERFKQLRGKTDEKARRALIDSIDSALRSISEAAHDNLPQLLGVARRHADQMSEAWLSLMVKAASLAFHAARAGGDDRKLAGTLLDRALETLEWLDLLTARRMEHQESLFIHHGDTLFHFTRAAIACARLQPEKDARRMRRLRRLIAWFVLRARLDFYSLPARRQEELGTTIEPLLGQMDVRFIPAGKEIEPEERFWLEWSADTIRERPRCRKILAEKDDSDRIAVAIDPLIEKLNPGSVESGGELRTAENDLLASFAGRHVRRSLGRVRRRGGRQELGGRARISRRWSDVVNLNTETDARAVEMVDADEFGAHCVTPAEGDALPEVDDLIVVDFDGGDARRARVAWRRCDERKCDLGCAWVGDAMQPVVISLLGHSVMSTGVRRWEILARERDDGHLRCWLGDPSIQPGFSVLLARGDGTHVARLERVDYRGANFCRGLLSVGEEWKGAELELET